MFSELTDGIKPVFLNLVKALAISSGSPFQFIFRFIPFWTVVSRIVWRGIFLALLTTVFLAPTPVWAAALPSSSIDYGYAPAVSAAAAINVVAVLPPTLTVSVSSINLKIAIENPARPSGLFTVPVTSSWNVTGTTTGVELVAFFDSPDRALVDSRGDAIPSSRVLGAIYGEPRQAFNETASIGTPGASRRLFRERISQRNLRETRTDILEVQVDSAADLSVPAGEYSGVLHLRVISY